MKNNLGIAIVHITQYFHPLKGYQENQFAKYHKNNFARVFIIASCNTRLWGSIPKNVLEKLDLEYTQKTGVEVIRLKTFPLVISDRIFSSGLIKKLNQINPDYIYVHSLSSTLTILTSYWISLNKKKKHIKTIIDDHMVYVASRNFFSSLLYKLLSFVFLRRFLSAYDKWIAVSEETKEFLIDKFSKKLINKIEVIPLGVDLGLFKHDLEAREKTRLRLNLEQHTKLIVYTGKRDNRKNPLILLPTLKRLMNQGLNYKLLLVGENINYYDDSINQYISKNIELKGRVIIKPPVRNEELLAIYSAADCAIWPNQSSMSMLEAMACLCPVIASDIKVNVERLGDGRGVLFVNGDIESLINAILKVNDMSNSLTDTAYRWVKNYSWEKLAEKALE